MGVSILKWKCDWKEARERWSAWRHGEVLDRVALAVYAPRDKPVEETKVETPKT